ncbi:hypothetical protein [Yinghuangia seranimata]|uniref:hypothetical protein n=1 Tax=Yinghuangia seranimata TaxID=408067 RepID=UPI00248B6934|nr:hypothetical protein [Yinghuangia seranimata]MDI2124675.1 hypothetical protein [Yinghuangia seranimata]
MTQPPWPHGPYDVQEMGAGPGYEASYDGTMPREVRVVRYLMSGSGVAAVVVTVVAGILNSAFEAGVVLGSALPYLVAPVLGERFGKGRNALRVGSIVCASFMILFGLGLAGRGYPIGLIGVGVSVTAIVYLSRPTARMWFSRPKTGF